jgi:phage/plasmid-associated DNA primase
VKSDAFDMHLEFKKVLFPLLEKIGETAKLKCTRLIEDGCNSVCIVKHAKSHLVRTNGDFFKLVDAASDLQPTRNGMVVELKTLTQRVRTKTDYFTFELPWTLLSERNFLEGTLSVPYKWILGLCTEKDAPATMSEDEKLAFDHKVRYLTFFLGYLLTGDHGMRTMLVIIGPPGTGKSKFIDKIEEMSGRRCTPAKVNLVCGYDHDDSEHGHTAGYNVLIRKNWFFMTESREGVPLKVNGVSKLVGDSKLPIRRLNQEAEETGAIYHGNPVLVTNFLPLIRGTPEQIADAMGKLGLVEMNNTFDTKLASNELFVNETMHTLEFNDAFFTLNCMWAKEYYDNERTFPMLKKDTTVYNKYNGNSVTRFAANCLVKSTTGEYLSSAELYVVYKWFARIQKIEEEKIASSTEVGTVLEATYPGFAKKKNGKTSRCRRGVAWNVKFFASQEEECMEKSVVALVEKWNKDLPESRD